MHKSSALIRETLQPFIDHQVVSGAVALVATKDRILSLDAIGWADLATQKPMTPDSLFWIASMTKPMTATALMMLVDAGQVRIEDSVEKYLPEFKGQMVIAEKDDDHVLLKKPQHPITVREVLSHTSGLPFSFPIEGPPFDRMPLADRVRVYAMAPLQSEPGAKYCYSNAGTNTAARILEVVSGTPYPVFMDRNLLGPLRMSETTFWPSKEQLKRFAAIYRSNHEKTGLELFPLSQSTPPYDNPARQPLPAGGLFSTAADCAKFCQMLLNGGVAEGRRYVSDAAIAEMKHQQNGDGIPNEYGLCFQLGGTYGHDGAYKTRMAVDPRLGLITVLLVHRANDWDNDEGRALVPAFQSAAEKVLAKG
jgi:CubicO group peptidase (beta-lactamase class C family)